MMNQDFCGKFGQKMNLNKKLVVFTLLIKNPGSSLIDFAKSSNCCAMASPKGPSNGKSTCKIVTKSINDEPGFLWKIWTENESEQEAGGIYAFDTYDNAQQYLNRHRTRLNSMGVPLMRHDYVHV
jgi:hypothetical protein